ncbi:hypothetical protein [Liquorilactobacillus mali]|uniref:hypothetical protein n=1 Tax=Liquorilactobacillus mali TaxID=1618 RepID=UPI002955090C|nr:hypothetical protein [Liquorilactobacillus mali]MDV7757908.1 hypothetical protein [Liquorilactobacillus mali]
MKKSILIYGCITASLAGILLYRQNKKKVLVKDNLENHLLEEPVGEKANTKNNLVRITDGPDLIKIHSKSDAVSTVEAQLGNNDGDWTWNCLWCDDEKFFVKAISKTALAEGAMTGTAYSVFVYRDGSVKEDSFELNFE